jgi:hypothetical protein
MYHLTFFFSSLIETLIEFSSQSEQAVIVAMIVAQHIMDFLMASLLEFV